MPRLAYRQETLDRAGREFADFAAHAPARCESPSGQIRVTHQIPLDYYLNARSNGESFNDKTYLRDMERRCPEIKVKREGRNGRVVFAMRTDAAVATTGVGRMTRHGKVTFHKVYP